MSVDIAESLASSWLRHVKCCQIVQTNLKKSPYWRKIHNDENNIIEMCRKTFESEFPLLNKKKKTIKKKGDVEWNYDILRQAEIDSIGICLSKRQIMCHALEIAFHENRLHYNTKDEKGLEINDNKRKILRKCLAIAMFMYVYLGLTKGNIYFVSPKIGTDYNEIKKLCSKLQKTLNDSGLTFSINCWGNEEFEKNVLAPIKEKYKEVNDSSESFLRALKLLNLKKIAKG